jgi:hypothetical protein
MPLYAKDGSAMCSSACVQGAAKRRIPWPRACIRGLFVAVLSQKKLLLLCGSV